VSQILTVADNKIITARDRYWSHVVQVFLWI